MPHRPDFPALVAGYTDVIEMVNSGVGGLAAIGHLLRVAAPAIGATGLAFVAYDGGGGRVVAATGNVACAVGRPVPVDGPTAGWLARAAPQVLRTRVDASPWKLAEPADNRRRMTVARAEAGGRTVGSLHVSHPDGGEVCDETVARLATFAAHVYDTRGGWPAPGDGPSGDGPSGAETPRRDPDRDLFVAVTSHELRTPVTVIKGYADTLANHWESMPEPDRRQAVRAIGQRAGELARLVDRLLSTAPDTGPVGGAPPTPFDLVETLRAAAAELPAHLRRRLVLALPENLPKALGDRASLATVLTELATNADKYSPGETPVELRAEADRRTVAFRVSDRGIGIRPEHVERAFDRFWQGEAVDRHRYPGAGLGLYLVRRIVERQNGWVSLRPRRGGGTVAEVRLPRG